MEKMICGGPKDHFGLISTVLKITLSSFIFRIWRARMLLDLEGFGAPFFHQTTRVLIMHPSSTVLIMPEQNTQRKRLEEINDRHSLPREFFHIVTPLDHFIPREIQYFSDSTGDPKKCPWHLLEFV